MQEEKEDTYTIEQKNWARNLLDNYTEAVEAHVRNDYGYETNNAVIDLGQKVLDYLNKVRVR